MLSKYKTYEGMTCEGIVMGPKIKIICFELRMKMSSAFVLSKHTLNELLPFEN